jgi:hypothetical protein
MLSALGLGGDAVASLGLQAFLDKLVKVSLTFASLT